MSGSRSRPCFGQDDRGAFESARLLLVVAQLGERRPARVGLGLVVFVGLHVQILSAHGTEAGTVGSAEDLVRKLERDDIARPGAHLQFAVRDVVRPELVARGGIGVVELTGDRVDLDLRVRETPHARADEVNVQMEVEEQRTRGLCDLELDRHRSGTRMVTLPTEQERLEVDVEALATDFPGTEA